jgi:hypothetical protein
MAPIIVPRTLDITLQWRSYALSHTTGFFSSSVLQNTHVNFVLYQVRDDENRFTTRVTVYRLTILYKKRETIYIRA